MRWVFVILCVVGITAASLALREHYRQEGDSPCSINERWDCGIVNHSQFAVIAGVPVGVIGIVGYLFLGALSYLRAYRLLLLAAIPALAFSLYLAHIEASVLGVWCVYCAISLGVISLVTLLALGTVIALSMNRSKQSVQA